MVQTYFERLKIDSDVSGGDLSKHIEPLMIFCNELLEMAE